MNRWKAATLHLTVSIVVASLVGALLFFLWFPPPYFVAAGASALLLLLVGVDVCIGPLLTLIACSPGKRHRLVLLDLTIIIALQITAFAYGAYTVCRARPVFIVGEVDRLVIVAADEIAPTDLAKATLPEARSLSWHGPRLVGAQPPSGPGAFDVVAHALAGGKDIDRLPQYYAPYQSVAKELLKHAKPLATLKQISPTQRATLQKSYSMGKIPRHLVYLPLVRMDHSYTAILDTEDAKPVAVLDVNPWR